MRKFWLYRYKDPTGVSGTGWITEGVEFSSGQCVMVWLGHVASVVLYPNIKQLQCVHGHSGYTQIIWEGGDDPETKSNPETGEQVPMDGGE